MARWNPWHGCKKISPGCLNCYVYRIDGKHGRDASVVSRNNEFDLPLRRNKNMEFKLKAGETVYTCFSSDFFLDEADIWRGEAWEMIRIRSDLQFLIITKRIDRFQIELPRDWGKGWENVAIYSTVENSVMAERRLPILMDIPVKHKGIMCEPLLEEINLMPYLGDWIEQVVVGGESGVNARPCDYDWVLSIHEQCNVVGVPFIFKQTGANFIKDGKHYRILRKDQHVQAFKAGLNTGRI